MLEVVPESGRGFVYGDEALEQLRLVLELTVERSEKVSGIRIHTVCTGECAAPAFSLDLSQISEVKCIHGRRLQFSSVNRLPQEGWEELIDCWSCHNSEFRSMLDLKMVPRKNGILVSNFYLLAHRNVVPLCCREKTKLFYNELCIGYPYSHLVYKFFEEYFANKGSIVLEYEKKAFEIKLFYKCILFKDAFKEALKVGIKETDKQPDCDGFIGEFFKQVIFDEIEQNSLGIKIMGYSLSFITYE